MNELPQLGKLVPEGENRRDAVHIAIAPMVAGLDLKPGDHVVIFDSNYLGLWAARAGSRPDLKPVGIVDPFLTEPVKAGQRFWLFLYPNTVTSLRHVWTHPAFTTAYHQKQKESGQ